MRHLHFVQSLDPLRGGGLATASLGLHGAMLRLGIRSTVISTNYGRPEAVTVPGVEQFGRIPPQAGFFAPRLMLRSRQIVDAVDVVHGHGFYVGTNWLLGRQARRQQKPLVYHPHGMFEPYILRRSRTRKRIVHVLFENANFRSARLWRALTSTEADQIRALLGNVRIVVVPNGVELPPEPSRSSKEARRLAYLGRLHPKKGLETLFGVWASIASAFPKWELVVAGPGEPNYADELKGCAARLPRVTMLDAVRGDAKAEYLASSDLFVLPSLSEGFPMALLEAMAASLPVVVTSTSNPPPVHSLGAGWICDPTSESLQRALTEAMSSDDGALRERGSVGRRYMEQNYAWSVVARTLASACAPICR
jgi:glycosyltransferase involved in cell wall biosynthesis